MFGPDQDLNQVPHEYYPEPLPLEQIRSTPALFTEELEDYKNLRHDNRQYG
jgi:hypothetical protein